MINGVYDGGDPGRSSVPGRGIDWARLIDQAMARNAAQSNGDVILPDGYRAPDGPLNSNPPNFVFRDRTGGSNSPTLVVREDVNGNGNINTDPNAYFSSGDFENDNVNANSGSGDFGNGSVSTNSGNDDIGNGDNGFGN